MASKISTRNRWPYPKVIAHRLCGTLAPENTMAALKRAVALGVEAVETDAMLTSDGVLILSHDEALGRVVRGTGKVSAMTAAELRELNAGILCAPEFSGERMALLSEAMEFCKLHAIRMNIEIKPALGQDEQTGRAVAKAVQEAYRDYPGTLPLLSSFSSASLAAAAGAAPELSRALLLETMPRDWKSLAESLRVVAVHPDAALATGQFVAEVLDAGYQMMVYTVDDHRAGQELLGLGVDAICTNRPDLFL